MKKKIIILSILVFVILWGVRFSAVNRNVDKAETILYPRGEIVPVGEDYFDYASEHMEGYTVQVLGAELVTAEEFLERYDALDRLPDLGWYTNYIYAVRVSIGNEDNPYGEEKGISLMQYQLLGPNYILSIEDVCFSLANPTMPGLSFALRQNTSKEILLPYAVMNWETSCEHILKDPPRLQITQYPHQKLLETA